MDIRMLLQASAARGEAIDWELVSDYLEIFGQEQHLRDLEHWHGSTE